MSTYAVGDLQGCMEALKRLLDELAFDPAEDQVWLSGDLVNRGPDSLGVLRYVRGLGDSAVAVLGNHDLHLLAAAQGRRAGKRDTLADVLNAPDRDDLLDWLRHRPLVHRSKDGRWLMLHAGLPPQWTVDQALACAHEVESALRGAGHVDLLIRMYGDQPDRWDPDLTDMDRLRFIINCYTRLRYCAADGRLDPDAKGEPGQQPAGLLPWFAVPGRRSAEQNIVFGHWSTLGRVHWPEHRVWGLDTGCVWGGRLSALCLETGQVHSVICEQVSKPG